MVLQAAPQISELDRRDWTSDAAILFRMQLVFAGIQQHTIAVDISLIGKGLVRLAAIVEGDWIGPDVLLALAYLLAIVLPVHAVPEKVVVDVMFKTGPDSGARVCSRRVNHNRAGGRTAAVINPVLASAATFFSSALDVVAKWAGVPDIDRAIEFLHIMFGYKCRQRLAWARIRVNVVGELANVLVLRRTGFVG